MPRDEYRLIRPRYLTFPRKKKKIPYISTLLSFALRKYAPLSLRCLLG